MTPLETPEQPCGRTDPTLYAGSAPFYATGRVTYPAELVDALVASVPLDGTGRLLDVGCGPGSLTLLLAPHVAEAVGLDPDADMLGEATRLAAEAGIGNVSWRRLRAEELPADLGPFTVATLAQSFHWMDRPRVAGALRGLLPGGALVHVHANTHQGVDAPRGLARPMPPWDEVQRLVRGYLGPRERAGAGHRALPPGGTEGAVYRGAGFRGPDRVEVPGQVVTRTVAEVAASVHSLSSAAPHLFGDRWPAFDRELRALLAAAAADGRFDEELAPVVADIWR